MDEQAVSKISRTSEACLCIALNMPNAQYDVVAERTTSSHPHSVSGFDEVASVGKTVNLTSSGARYAPLLSFTTKSMQSIV